MGIPALERGLTIINHMILTQDTIKYSELKQVLPGISDASLGRLLLTLIEHDYVEKNADGEYILGEKVKSWKTLMVGNIKFKSQCKSVVDQLVKELGESVAVAELVDNRIEIIYSCSAQDSISIIKTGEILHFERDHAASIAILNRLSQEHQMSLISGEYSKIDNFEALRDSIQNTLFKHKSNVYYLDHSIYRKGISRLAIPFNYLDKQCVIFICSLSSVIDDKKEIFFTLLDNKTRQFKNTVIDK